MDITGKFRINQTSRWSQSIQGLLICLSKSSVEAWQRFGTIHTETKIPMPLHPADVLISREWMLGRRASSRNSPWCSRTLLDSFQQSETCSWRFCRRLGCAYSVYKTCHMIQPLLSVEVRVQVRLGLKANQVHEQGWSLCRSNKLRFRSFLFGLLLWTMHC